MKHRVRHLLTLLALAGAAACASSRAEPFSAAAAERQMVQIDVLNNNFADATLWAVIQDARRVRLGNVTGKTDARFTLPWTFTLPLRIEIDMVAGPRCVTRPIDVDPGDVLQLEIKAVFFDTAYCERQ